MLAVLVKDILDNLNVLSVFLILIYFPYFLFPMNLFYILVKTFRVKFFSLGNFAFHPQQGLELIIIPLQSVVLIYTEDYNSLNKQGTNLSADHKYESGGRQGRRIE